MNMNKTPTFRRFLLIMVFLLEGLSLAIVIGFLFAMLDRSMIQEHVSRINVQQGELRLHLTNRLNYTYTRTEEIRFNNNIKIALLLKMHPKIAESMQALYPQTIGSCFYVRSKDGRFFPKPGKNHAFLKNSHLFESQPTDVTQLTVNPHTIVYLMPIFQQDRIIGHAVGIYDLIPDSHCLKLLASFNDLSLVYRQKEQMKALFTHQPLAVSSHRVTKALTRKQYQDASDGCLAMLIGMKAFPSLFLVVDNEQYRQRRMSMVTKLIFLCIPLLMLTFTFSFLILKRVTCELDDLAKSALHIAKADVHSDLDTEKVRHAEFLYFTQAFNKVLSTVRQRTEDLQNANENLQKQIEERRQIADALQESEAQLRSLQDNIPIGLFRRSIDGRLLFANPRMVSIFGYDSEDEMIQVSVRKLYHDPEQYDFIMERFETSENIQSVETRFKRKDGTTVWGAVHLKLTFDTRSGIAYIDGAFLDITDRKKIENDKRKLETQLRQAHKMEALGTLAGGIAHDFNNILFAIIGFCELAVEDADSDTPQQSNIQQAIAGAQRAAELVRQILTFARQDDIEKHPLNLTSILKEGLKLLRATLPKNIEIRTELDGHQTILADPTQMHQIIVNLCTNACHAMRDTGGVMTICLSKIEITPDYEQSEIGLKPGAYAWLRIMDSGHGMSSKTLERIFDPYYTTKAQGDGTGMGLSVVQGIVRSLSGTIRVDSFVGKGTTFNVYLPALEEIQLSHHQNLSPVVGGKEHILFVDDELPLTSMVSQMLSNIGYEVTTRNSPLDALDLFRTASEQFDLVISDVIMPQMAGYDMAREMLKIRPNLPILLCTGYVEALTEKTVSDIGACALLYKPLVRSDLFSTIRDVLDRPQAA